jgi:hypothetical protein
MSDRDLREAGRAWETSRSPEAAAAYLAALERAGRLAPASEQPPEPPEPFPVSVEYVRDDRGRALEAVEVDIGGVGLLFSYRTLIGARIPGRGRIWCPAEAYSRTSQKHARLWGGDHLDEVSAEELQRIGRAVIAMDLEPEPEPEPEPESEPEPEPRWFITIYPYTWGRGNTPEEAKRTARRHGGRGSAWYTLAIPEGATNPSVNGMGFILWDGPAHWGGLLPVVACGRQVEADIKERHREYTRSLVGGAA